MLSRGVNHDHISLKLPEKEGEKERETNFKMYVMDISYFSGKLETYFRYQVGTCTTKQTNTQKHIKNKKKYICECRA